MASTYLDLREEVLWAALILASARIKKKLFLQEHPTKASCLCVIGQLVQLMRLVVKTIL
jgi:hypothetical protein